MIKQKITEDNQYDENGNLISSKKKLETFNILTNKEPDYIKLYTRMWCEFNQIPMGLRPLFLSLVTKMGYCNTTDMKHSNIVYTIGVNKTSIMEELGWKSDRALQKGLRNLCEINAIRKVSRGCYQINPCYATRGSWEYNPKRNDGGVADLVAVFHFKEHYSEVDISWDDAMDMVSECDKDGNPNGRKSLDELVKKVEEKKIEENKKRIEEEEAVAETVETEAYSYSMPNDNPNKTDIVSDMIARQGNMEHTETYVTTVDNSEFES